MSVDVLCSSLAISYNVGSSLPSSPWQQSWESDPRCLPECRRLWGEKAAEDGKESTEYCSWWTPPLLRHGWPKERVTLGLNSHIGTCVRSLCCALAAVYRTEVDSAPYLERHSSRWGRAALADLNGRAVSEEVGPCCQDCGTYSFSTVLLKYLLGSSLSPLDCPFVPVSTRGPATLGNREFSDLPGLWVHTPQVLMGRNDWPVFPAHRRTAASIIHCRSWASKPAWQLLWLAKFPRGRGQATPTVWGSANTTGPYIQILEFFCFFFLSLQWRAIENSWSLGSRAFRGQQAQRRSS